MSKTTSTSVLSSPGRTPTPLLGVVPPTTEHPCSLRATEGRFPPDSTADPIVNALTVDMEEHFQAVALRDHLSRTEWYRFDSRIELNALRLLELFETHRVKATFFVLGWIAERHPRLVRELCDFGHEIASHGWENLRVSRLSREELREDLRRTKSLLEEITGTPVLGYRAPGSPIDEPSDWALEVIAETGHLYDCSPRRSIPRDRPATPLHHELCNGYCLYEFPPSTVALGRWQLPLTEGHWLRRLPAWIGRWGLSRLNRSGRPAMLRIRSWEIDAEQPRLKVDPLTRFRHYRNLHKTHGRLDDLLGRFPFGTVSRSLGIASCRTATSVP